MKFIEEKKLLELKIKYEKTKNALIMERLKYERHTGKITHEDAMTRQRIKTAEIRKSQLMRGMR